MTKTKNSLLMSAIALLLCVSMFIGTTFAWFTDSVTSSNNKIESGTLKLDLLLYNGTDYQSIKTHQDPIFNYNKWEPGYMDVKFLQVKNDGTLALKWVAQFVAKTELSPLADVIDVYVKPSTTALTNADKPNRDLTGWDHAGTLRSFVNTIEQTTYGTLVEDQSAYLGIALKMQESANNDYQGLDLGGAFDIRIFATQLNSEIDSIDKDYDKDAQYAKDGYGMAKVEDGEPYYEIDVINKNSSNPKEKIGTATIPAGAVADGAETLGVNMSASDYDANITVKAGNETLTFDISVDGLKENNDVPVTIRVYVGKGFDPDTFKLYHYDEEIYCTYDPSSGYVIFEATEFSPFTIEYDKESVYVPEETSPEDLPKATVVKLDLETDETVLQFVEETGRELEAAYKFAAPDDGSESPYKTWECDFYVKLDRDLESNQIMLAGNYGQYNWVWFTNEGITLEANTEIPLLGYVTKNPWTYEMIAGLVGEFICGVSDVDDALADATFTVMLRLTNPEDESEFYNVATVEHTFTKTVYSGDELQDAINNGNSNIQLGGDIDLSQGIVIP